MSTQRPVNFEPSSLALERIAGTPPEALNISFFVGLILTDNRKKELLFQAAKSKQT